MKALRRRAGKREDKINKLKSGRRQLNQALVTALSIQELPLDEFVASIYTVLENHGMETGYTEECYILEEQATDTKPA